MSREDMMTITEAPATDNAEHQQVTVEDAIALLLEDITDLEEMRRHRHLFPGNGSCTKRIVILPYGANLRDFKGCVVSHLRGTFAPHDSILHQAMEELHRRHYHVLLVEYHYCCIREDKVPYHVYQVGLFELQAPR